MAVLKLCIKNNQDEDTIYEQMKIHHSKTSNNRKRAGMKGSKQQRLGY